MIIILGLVQFALDKKYRKEGEYESKMSETDGFAAYAWTIVIVTVVGFVLFIFTTEMHIVILYLMVLAGIRGIFEYKYIKSTNRHIVSIWMVVILAILWVPFLLI